VLIAELLRVAGTQLILGLTSAQRVSPSLPCANHIFGLKRRR